MPAKKASDYIDLRGLVPLVYELTGVTRTMEAVRRWYKIGRINTHGVVVKLKVTKRLGQYYSTREWLEDFIIEVG